MVSKSLDYIEALDLYFDDEGIAFGQPRDFSKGKLNGSLKDQWDGHYAKTLDDETLVPQKFYCVELYDMPWNVRLGSLPKAEQQKRLVRRIVVNRAMVSECGQYGVFPPDVLCDAKFYKTPCPRNSWLEYTIRRYVCFGAFAQCYERMEAANKEEMENKLVKAKIRHVQGSESEADKRTSRRLKNKRKAVNEEYGEYRGVPNVKKLSKAKRVKSAYEDLPGVTDDETSSDGSVSSMILGRVEQADDDDLDDMDTTPPGSTSGEGESNVLTLFSAGASQHDSVHHDLPQQTMQTATMLPTATEEDRQLQHESPTVHQSNVTPTIANFQQYQGERGYPVPGSHAAAATMSSHLANSRGAIGGQVPTPATNGRPHDGRAAIFRTPTTANLQALKSNVFRAPSTTKGTPRTDGTANRVHQISPSPVKSPDQNKSGSAISSSTNKQQTSQHSTDGQQFHYFSMPDGGTGCTTADGQQLAWDPINTKWNVLNKPPRRDEYPHMLGESQYAANIADALMSNGGVAASTSANVRGASGGQDGSFLNFVSEEGTALLPGHYRQHQKQASPIAIIDGLSYEEANAYLVAQMAPPGIVALHHVMYHHTNAMMNNVLRQVTEQMALRQTDAPTANSGDTYLRTAFAEVNAKLDVLLPDTTPIDLPLPEKLAGKLPCRTKADFHHFNNLMMEKNELFAETVEFVWSAVKRIQGMIGKGRLTPLNTALMTVICRFDLPCHLTGVRSQLVQVLSKDNPDKNVIDGPIRMLHTGCDGFRDLILAVHNKIDSTLIPDMKKPNVLQKTPPSDVKNGIATWIRNARRLVLTDGLKWKNVPNNLPSVDLCDKIRIERFAKNMLDKNPVSSLQYYTCKLIAIDD